MNKQKVSTKSSAIFLATVLIAGTIALSFPSFMTGAEAYPYNNNYDNDHKFKYKPSFDKFGKSSSSYNKCINANLNFPGLDFSPSFGAEAVDALGVESLTRDGGNSGPNGGHDDGFKKFNKDGLICINANDNSVRGGIDRGDGDGDGEETECGQDIEACFRVFLTQQQFSTLESALNAGITVEIAGEDVTLNSFSDVCDALEGLTIQQLETALFNILVEAGILEPTDPINEELVECTAGKL